MSESLGSIIDRLLTIDLKLWNAQEDIYIIRKMSFDEFKKSYFNDDDGAKKIWEFLKKATDLNCQRATLVDEIDHKIVEIINAKINGEDLDNGNFIQRKHKTY